MTGTLRRGWREAVEPGISRGHTTSCPSTSDRKTGRRCACPWFLVVPALRRPGTTTTAIFRGTLTGARAERQRALLAERPALAASPGVVRDYARRWFKAGAHRWSPRTFETRERAYRVHIDPAFGAVPPGQIDTADIERWVVKLLGCGQPRRQVEIAYETLRPLLGWIVGQRELPVNPASGVRFPQRPPAPSPAERVITGEQTQALLRACLRIEHETIVRVAVESGLRRGEIAGLLWTDIDLPARRINVRRAVTQPARAGKIERRPKMGKSGRVAISDELASALERQKTQNTSRGRPDDQGLVWPGRDGGPMSPSSITHLIQRLCRRAGLVDATGATLIHLHGLRHTAASAAISAGVPITVVAAQLRHSRPTTTMQVYAHLMDDRELDRFLAHRKPTPDATIDGEGSDARNGRTLRNEEQ